MGYLVQNKDSGYEVAGLATYINNAPLDEIKGDIYSLASPSNKYIWYRNKGVISEALLQIPNDRIIEVIDAARGYWSINLMFRSQFSNTEEILPFVDYRRGKAMKVIEDRATNLVESDNDRKIPSLNGSSDSEIDHKKSMPELTPSPATSGDEAEVDKETKSERFKRRRAERKAEISRAQVKESDNEIFFDAVSETEEEFFDAYDELPPALSASLKHEQPKPDEADTTGLGSGAIPQDDPKGFNWKGCILAGLAIIAAFAAMYFARNTDIAKDLMQKACEVFSFAK